MLPFLAALLFTFVSAETFQVPALTGPVVDLVGLIATGEKNNLEAALRALNQSRGTQLQVVIVPDLSGLTIEQASIKITDQWKLGDKKTDKAVLLLVAMTTRQIRIEVGQGLEGVLTDALSSRIIRETITPLFKTGEYSSGILLGIYQIAQLTDPDFDMQPYLEGTMRPSRPGRVKNSKTEFILFIIFFFIVMFLNRLTPGRRFRQQRSYGGFGVGGFGGGGFGGSGGGGWSGGGGGFSGGGASGSW